MTTLRSSLIAMAAAVLVVQANPAAAGAPALHSWSQKLTTKRFTVLKAFGGEAVLDKETGLVWEQSPSPTPINWAGAENRCNGRKTGGRIGWRLPALQELQSLIDPSAVGAPQLTPGHPFSNVQPHYYWSATDLYVDSSFAWIAGFGVGLTGTNFPKSDDTNIFVWCVRGGAGASAQ